MLKFLSALLIFFYLCCAVRGQDSLSVVCQKTYQQKIDKFTSSKIYRMTFLGLPLVVGGLIVKEEDDHFRSLRNDYLPKFSQHYDDYLQYLPGIVMLGMKVGGVEGRSSWGRMLVSDAFSAALMGVVVNTLKTTTNVTRPDGSNHHSFPSGHTATAFMMATMMHKEYGERSPWYSIGAYSVATATGLTRQLNNKHWMSDVLVGAGIGILSTELGYYFADLIFKEKGIRHPATPELFTKDNHPSFVGLYLGLNIFPGHYELSNGAKLKFSTGSNAGLEGAYFFTNHWGVGGRFSASNVSITQNEVEAQNETLDMISAYTGIYVSCPLSSRWLVGGRLLGGYTYFQHCELTNLSIGGRGGMSGSTGVTFTFLAKKNLGMRFFMDYTVMPSVMSSTDKCMQTWTLGGAFSITW